MIVNCKRYAWSIAMKVSQWLAASTVLGLLAMATTAPAQTSKPGGTQRSARAANSQKQPAEVAVDDFNGVSATAKTEKATFGGGCFWCVEAVFERVPGVKAAVSGYAAGDRENFPIPTYELVCSGETGYAEVLQVEYDPKAVTYEKLLEVFFTCHDPTTLNRQGPDRGTQYRSIILAHDQTQAKLATQFIERLNANQVFGAPVVTQVAPLDKFFPAEAYHQDYYRKHPNAPYCQAMIPAKLEKLKHVEFPAAADSKAPAKP